MSKIDWPILILPAVGAGALHSFTAVGLGAAVAIFFVALPLVGTLITVDDDLPGGWSNPDGKSPPPWRTAPFWGQIIWGCSLACAGFAVDFGWVTSSAIALWAASAIAMAASLALIKRAPSQ